jgi:acyl transferase domain-containing protein
MHDIDVRNSYVGGGPAPLSGPAPRGPGEAAQDRELLLLDAPSLAELRGRIAQLAESAGELPSAGLPSAGLPSAGLPSAGLGDLAATLQRELGGGPVRAAVVAASADEAAERLAKLLTLLDGGARSTLDVAGGVFLGGTGAAPRIGYLFPGQGSGRGDDGGALARRFQAVRDLYQSVTLPAGDDPTATSVAQPRIVRSSAAGLRVLSLLGIQASAAVGHSLGELTALHWAGAMSEADVIDLARARGQIMTEASAGGGAMAGVVAGPADVESLLADEPVVIAGYNGPGQTVVAGPAEAVERVRSAAAARGVKTIRLAVSDAFHSPAMAPAATGLRDYLAGRQFGPLERHVVSTVTGDILPSGTDLTQLLVSQLCEPVRFTQALTRMAAGVSVLIEVGPGRVLSGLAAKVAPQTPVIPLATDGSSLSGVLSAVAAAHVLGGSVRHDLLFADRTGSTAGRGGASPPRPRPGRFAGRPRVYRPGKEVVADAELPADSDPHLAPHLLDGKRLFPAALALEAMAQVAAPLAGTERIPAFENIGFLRPVVLPPGDGATIRVAARREGDQVSVAIRSSGTGFEVDHARATLRYGGDGPHGPGLKRPTTQRTWVPLDPATDLHRAGLAQDTRLLGFRRLAARWCVAEVSTGAIDRRSAGLLLGDPAARDAVIHAIQNCVPDTTLLPAGVRWLYPARLSGSGSAATPAGRVVVYAAERHRAGNSYFYDLDIYAQGGRLLERWQGLRLVAVRRDDGVGPWAPALLGPYLERQLADLVPHAPLCAVEPDPSDPGGRRGLTAAAVSRILGRPALVWHRGDGRPEIAEDGLSVGAAHGAGVLLTVTGTGKLRCDVGEIQEGTASLSADQLGLAERIAQELDERQAVAAARIRGAVACLGGTARPGAAPITLARCRRDGWVVLAAGQARIATFPTRVRDNPSPVMFTIATEGRGNEGEDT